MIFGAPVFAAAYPKDYDFATMPTLIHAISDEPIQFGKLKRAEYEAFCDKKLNVMDDSTQWTPTDEITCDRCKSIVARMKDA